MLIKNTLKYLPAQLMAPAAQLVSMILWTHWLEPREMGLFTLVAVAQEMAYVFCLGWFSVYALRYMPADNDPAGRARYLSTENVVVLSSVAAGIVAAAVTTMTLPPLMRPWLSWGVIAAYFITRAINMHYAERARAQSAFVAYTVLQVAGPLGGLGLGLLAFRTMDPTPWVLLGSYAVAQGVGMLLALPLLGMHWKVARPDGTLLHAAFGFGFPILGLGVLGWVAENYIRYVVQWQAGAATLGLMVVGWSLGRRCASVASMLVATAAFPLASRLLNEGKRDEAMVQLSINAGVMLAVLIPVTAALELLGPALVALTVAPEYAELTTELLGLSVLGGAVRNLHMHVTDQLMVLERRLVMVAWIDVFEIIACAAATIAGLLSFGLHGAVAGQAAGSFLTLALSMWLAASRLGFRWPWLATVKVVLASAAMSAAIAWLHPSLTGAGLAQGIVVGSLTYVLAAAALFWRDLWPFVARRLGR